MTRPRPLLLAAASVSALAIGAAAPATAARSRPSPARQARHVLLISVDGMHQNDLTRYVRAHPASPLAALVRRGTSYVHAETPFPSDSFPGLLAQVTGGNPRTTGVYYDVSYNRDLLAPGTKACPGASRGTEVAYDESLDRDPDRLDAGQKLPGLPAGILAMTGTPRTLIDPAKLPVDPRTCRPVYPHSYLRVNTVFEVARAHGLRTAWADKHPAYDIVNGPSGAGVQDLFTPEIDSIDPALSGGDSWTSDNAATRAYDTYKVRAVLNEIDGLDHSGRRRVGVPALFGLNFQSVSTAQKLATSDGQPGGYRPDGVTPGPVLAGALGYVDGQVGRLLADVRRRGLAATTTVILSAKHAQSPQDGAALTRIDDGAVIDAMNTAWHSATTVDPATDHSADLVAGASDDDGMLLWLTDRSAAAGQFAASFLTSYNGDGTGMDGHAKATDIAKAPRAYLAAGLSGVLTGSSAAAFVGVRARDGRVPDVIGIAAHGVVYTGGTKKIAEHGGFDPADRNVPLVVSGVGVRHALVTTSAQTTQIAPTILVLLGLRPTSLQSVRAEGTPVLAGVRPPSR